MVSMEEPVGLSLDHVAGRLYWISEYKEVGMWGSRALPPQGAGSGEGGPFSPVAMATAWEGAGRGAQIWQTSLGWEGEGTTVSPVAVGQC